MWFEQNADRFAHEQSVVGQLQLEDWVKRVEWHVDQEGATFAEVLFEAGGKMRHALLKYPPLYPYLPPCIVPLIADQRWSRHQWGSGELCLEIRSDNWHPDFDGADMLRSARKLLDTEATLDPNGQPGIVANDHRFTEGQLMRLRYGRLLLSDRLLHALAQREPGVYILDFHNTTFENSCVCVAVRLGGGFGQDAWPDPGVPPCFVEKPNHFGLIAQIVRGDARHRALTATDMSPEQRWSAFSPIALIEPCFIVGVLEGRVLAKFLDATGAVDIYWMRMETQNRLPERSAHLSNKKVAILGCGSMGSKLAASLTRCGVRRFFLVDADILKTGNLVRHELDWREVGANKIDGLEKRLQRISPDVVVEKWLGALDAQVAPSTLQLCIDHLKECDLIVEATASGNGFNCAGAVADSFKVPVVWGRVFGGGFGGYIARSRPGLEPTPLQMRHDIQTFFQGHSRKPPPSEVDIDYAAAEDDQAPMIADDADVSVITAHLARLAIDTLRLPTDTAYPHAAYIIGLSAGWDFTEPFQTFPLDFNARATSGVALPGEEAA